MLPGSHQPAAQPRMHRTLIRLALALLAFAAWTPANARVHEVSERGFVVRQLAEIDASPDEVWKVLISPAQWWKKESSFSGDPANFSLVPRAGGCFCEILPDPDDPDAPPRGSVEHLRVIYAEEPRALRMSGALGPLQSDAVIGTLTIFLKESGGKTQVLWEYVVGGFLRRDPEKLASAVDLVLAGQLLSLAGQFGDQPPKSVLEWDGVGGESVEPSVEEAREIPEDPRSTGSQGEDGDSDDAVSENAAPDGGRPQDVIIGR